MKKLVLWDLPRVVFPLLVSAYLFSRAMEDGLDLRVYWAGAREFISGGNLYAAGLPNTPYGGMAFTYPPFAAAVLAPLAFLPVETALVVQTTGNLVLAGVAGWIIAAYLTSKGILARAVDARRLWLTALAITGALLLLGPWRNSMSLGQINPLLLVLISLDLLAATRRHPDGFLPKGLLTGIAAGIKLTPLVFLLYFVARGDLKSAGRMLASFAGTVLVMAVLAPALSQQYWFGSLRETNRVGVLSRFENISLRGVIARLELDAPTETVLWAGASVFVIALGALVVYVSRRNPDQWGAVGATALVMLLVSPVSWGHHWVWVAICIPALLGALADRRRDRTGLRRLWGSPAGILCLLLVVCFALQPTEAAQATGSPNPYASITRLSEMFVQSGAFVAVVVLAWLGHRYLFAARTTVSGKA